MRISKLSSVNTFDRLTFSVIELYDYYPFLLSIEVYFILGNVVLDLHVILC